MSETRRTLEKRARNAILQEAFFRWESAVNLALMMILAVLFPSLWWVFVLLGLLIEVAIGVSTMRNPAINAKAVATIFEREFHPQRIHSKALRLKTDRALEYLQKIEEAVARTREGVLRDRMKRATEEVVDWVEAIYRIAARVDTYNRNQLIARDRANVPKIIQDLRRRLAEEDDPAVRKQIEKTIADRERQRQNLEQLQNTMESAELQLERTLSALGTVYSQLLLLDTKGESARRAERLQEEIAEQVHQLQDLSEAMDEVYSS
ncbi:MAG: hypothetical protein D6796_02790 [Caldilineae bacterium]|nr:MAG: hypothetical protein D6796_02790 [Caldilineae bacterium]